MKNFNPFFVFFFVLIIVFGLLEFGSVLSKRPQSFHMWAQCDRASVARNYAENDMNFFKPRIHFTREGDGITGLEFPLMNYLPAICYKLFGFHELYYRLIMLITMTFGLLAAFLFSKNILTNSFEAGMIILIWFLSPILNFYTPNFIPDTASLGLILITWYFFFTFIKSEKFSHLLLFTLFAALACLIKITSLISIITILLITILSMSGIITKLNHRVDIPKKPFLFLSVFLIFALVYTWYNYAAWLNEHYQCGVFMLGIKRPESWSQFSDSSSKIIETTWPDLYNIYFKFFLLFSGLIILFNLKRTSRLLGLITLFLYIGNVGFIYLMYTQFEVHDYYFITLLPAVLFHMLTFFDLSKKISFLSDSIILKLVIPLLVVIGLIDSRNEQKFRYSKEGEEKSSYIAYNVYHDIESYLRSIGVDKNDKVVSLFDVSPNMSLYLMNQKGWSFFYDIDESSLKNTLSQIPKYLIANDSSLFKKDYIGPFISNKVGQFRNISVFKLR